MFSDRHALTFRLLAVVLEAIRKYDLAKKSIS